MFAAVASVLALAASAYAQSTPDPSIQTPPGVTQCQVSSVVFAGTHPPFIISISGQPGQAPLEDIVSGISDSPYPWLVNLEQGSYITLQIKDAVGQIQYSGEAFNTSPFSVLPSSNTTCLGTGGSTVAGGSTSAPGSSVSGPSSSGSGSLPATTGSSTPVSTPVSTPASSPSSTPRPSTSAPGTSPSGSGTSTPGSPTSTNAAPTMGAQWGVAGLIGLVGAAVLA